MYQSQDTGESYKESTTEVPDYKYVPPEYCVAITRPALLLNYTNESLHKELLAQDCLAINTGSCENES